MTNSKKSDYSSPEAIVLNLQTEGCLCMSGNMSTDLGDLGIETFGMEIPGLTDGMGMGMGSGLLF